MMELFVARLVYFESANWTKCTWSETSEYIKDELVLAVQFPAIQTIVPSELWQVESLLKFINNSWQENKRNHYSTINDEGGLDNVIPIIIKFCELLLQISLTIILLMLWEAISKTLKRVCHYISKHFEVGLKNSAMPHFFQPIFQCLDIW